MATPSNKDSASLPPPPAGAHLARWLRFIATLLGVLLALDGPAWGAPLAYAPIYTVEQTIHLGDLDGGCHTKIGAARMTA